jgi:hypothetical protein
MSKYHQIVLLKTKNWEYQLNKQDLWQMTTLIILGSLPLFISIFKYLDKTTTFIISGVVFILLILISLYVFVERLSISKKP